MSLRRFIKHQKILAKIAGNELTLPGEPLIYSIKYPVGNRTRSVQFYRNMQWKSLLKSFFRSYYNTKTPLVLLVRFYVSPPSSVKIPPKQLQAESIPAVQSYEICDYLLSFQEMLMHVLINSYRQFVKIDVEKYYSSNPRTVFKFMHWDHYVVLQNNNSDNSESESVSEDLQELFLQPKRKRDGTDKEACIEKPCGPTDSSIQGSAACDSAFQDSSSTKPARKKKKATASLATHQEA